MSESIQEHLQKNAIEAKDRETASNPEKRPAKSEERIQMAEFYGIYPQEEINRDINATIRKKEAIKSEKSKEDDDETARKMEAGIICRAINAFQLFGEYVHIMRASLWDDYFRGVDAIAQVEVPRRDENGQENPGKRQMMALSIDAVKTAGRGRVKEKIDHNLEKLEGSGQEIKYGKSFDGKFKGRLTEVLPVVLGLEKNNVEKFFQRMEKLAEASKKKSQDPSKENDLVYRALYLELMRDSIQLTLIREVIMQAEYYQERFKNNEKVMRKYGQVFAETISTFKEIEKLAERKVSSILTAEDDFVYKSIRDVCGRDYRLEEHHKARVYHA